MRKSRVIIIDDDADVRDGLGAWLAPTYEVVCFDGAETFLASISDVRAQDAQSTCLLLDFQMPGMNGVDLQGRIKLLNLEYPIIFMSGNALQSDVIDAWRGGAIDFVLKPFTALEIDKALAKSFALAEANRSDRTPAPDAQPSGLTTITRREAQVLLLLGKGMQQQEVAEKLALSLRTVKMYRAFLKNKLGLNTLVEIGRFCEINRAAIAKIAE